jgi:hypothetical protein
MYFDMEFRYIGGSVVQASIVPYAPENWESESCKLTPYVRYEYTRVSKKDPETDPSGTARINQARKKVKLYARLAKNKESVLRIVKDSVVIKLQPDVNAVGNVTVIYLEESLGSLQKDSIASKRTTRDIPQHLKEMIKEASKKKQR